MVAIGVGGLFDGATSRGPAVVYVEGGRIAAVDHRAAASSARGIIDLGEAVLMPGMIDAHVHLAFDASADVVGHLMAASEEELLQVMRAAARRALSAGVTTVRDLGDRAHLAIAVRDEIAADPRLGADVVPAGPPITTPGGHCWFLGGEATGVDGIRRQVRDHAAHGVEVIKVMASGGEMTPGSRMDLPQFSVEELRAAVEESHRLGLPITAHAHALEGIARAVAAGMDGIEHASFAAHGAVQPDGTLIDRLAASGTVVSLTLGWLPGSPLPARLTAVLPQLLDLRRRFVAAGVPLVVGTDAGIAPRKPHDVLPHGVVQMAEAMRPVEALRAVTSRAAEACGVGDRKGRIAPGYDADLLAVPADLLSNVDAVLQPLHVWHRGIPVG